MLYGSDKWNIKERDATRIRAVVVKYGRKTAGYTWADYKKKKTQTAKEINVTTVLDKIQEYRGKLLKHMNRMPRNKLLRIITNYRPKGRRNQGDPLKRLLDVWERNRSACGPTAC